LKDEEVNIYYTSIFNEKEYEALKDIDRFKPEHVGVLWNKLFKKIEERK
jgi:hypothetical protein